MPMPDSDHRLRFFRLFNSLLQGRRLPTYQVDVVGRGGDERALNRGRAAAALWPRITTFPLPFHLLHRAHAAATHARL